MTRNLREELDRFGDHQPDVWIAEPGDTLVGTVAGFDHGHTKFGDYDILLVQDDEGDALRSVWLMHAVLRSEITRHDPRPGDRIAIKRLTRQTRWKAESRGLSGQSQRRRQQGGSN